MFGKNHQQRKATRIKKAKARVKKKESKKKAKQANGKTLKQQMKKTSKMASDIVSHLDFGRHHRMEHLRDQLFIVLAIMFVGCIGGYHHYRVYRHDQLEALTSYTAHTSFSHTNNTSLSLHKTVLSKNGRIAYIPFSFNSMSAIPFNANEYTVSVGAISGHMAHPVNGQLVLFGSTARGAVLLHSNHKIANQPIEVIIRDNRNLNLDGQGGTTQNNPTAQSSGIQQYERKFNALDFKINPGALSVKRNPKLGTNDSMSSVYYQLMGKRDMKQAISYDKASRKGVKQAMAVSKEYSWRLKHLGFRLPKLPKWLKSNWRPHDAIRPDGVPRNKPNTKNNQQNVKNDAGYSPVDNSQDDVDNVQFPSELKKKDGTTTSDTNNSSLSKQDGDDNGSNGGSHINGGSVNNPSDMWSTLQKAWEDVLQYKHDIYSTNASSIFKIKATVAQMNKQASVGKTKHFHEVN